MLDSAEKEGLRVRLITDVELRCEGGKSKVTKLVTAGQQPHESSGPTIIYVS